MEKSRLAANMKQLIPAWIHMDRAERGYVLVANKTEQDGGKQSAEMKVTLGK